jgi:hypothetical protein
MHKTELEIFWRELSSREGFADVLPGQVWSIKGGKKRALAADGGRKGMRYRYVIREGNTAAVELQIETADSLANARVVQLLEKQRPEIEAAFGAALDWNEDATQDSGRARIRYWLGSEPVPYDPAARRRLQMAMIHSLRRLIRTLEPYVGGTPEER